MNGLGPLAICAMTEAYSKLKELGSGDKVTLGDKSTLDITGEETVDMDMFLNDGIKEMYTKESTIHSRAGLQLDQCCESRLC